MSSPHTYVLDLPYERPPLTANQRMHWAKKARIVSEVRRTAAWLARSQHLPRGVEHALISLVWVPSTQRRRDPSNLMPTQKAIVDGLVDYGLVPDDTPDYVTEVMPRIAAVQRGKRRSRLRLSITIQGENQ